MVLVAVVVDLSVVVASTEPVPVAVAETVAAYFTQRARPPEMADWSSPAAVQAPRMQPAPKPWTVGGSGC